jgi:hypothetical protein
MGINRGRPITIPAIREDGMIKYSIELSKSKISSGNNSYNTKPYTLIILPITNILKLSETCVN